MNQRLYRSSDDRIIAGVAGGVADYLRMDPSIVRIVWAILTVFSGGLLFLVYIVMWIVVPEEPFDWGTTQGAAAGPGAPPPPPPPVIPGWNAPGQPAGVEAQAAVPYAQPPESGTGGEETGAPAAAAAAGAAAGFVGATGEAAPAGPASQPAAGSAAPAATAPWPTDSRSARRAERAARRAERRAGRDNTGAIIFGLILVLVGGFFLVQMYVPSIDAGRFWPIVLVVVGAVLLVASIRPGSGEPRA